MGLPLQHFSATNIQNISIFGHIRDCAKLKIRDGPCALEFPILTEFRSEIAILQQYIGV